MAVTNITDRTDAGALVPEERVREIVQSLPQQSAALSLFQTVPMSSHVRSQSVLTALPYAYWVNGDTGLKQTTEQAWDRKQMVAEEIAVIVPVPENVIDDAEFDIFGEVQPRLVEAFGLLIDQAVLFGTNKPVSWADPAIVPGAVGAGNAVAFGTSTVDFVDDINNVMATVEDDGFDVNGFVARRRIRARLRGLRDANGGPIFSPSLTAGTPNTLYGEPLEYVSNGAWDDTAAELITGDFTKAIIGIRKDITYKVLTEGVISNDAGTIMLNLAQQDSIALRAVMRIGYALANPMNRMAATAANNELQTVAITGGPTGGTFTLTFDGQTTGDIAYNATASDVRTALEALNNIGAGNITTGGGALPGTAVTVTFINALSARNVPNIAATASLTGGTAPAVTVTETRAGSNPTQFPFGILSPAV